MTVRSGLCLVLIAWLGLPTSSPAQPVPARQPLSFPIVTRPGKALECVIACGPTAPVAALAFSPDGKRLATGGYQEVLVWDLAGGKLLRRVGVGGLNDLVHALAYHKDGHLLAVGEGSPGGPGSVKVYNVDTGALALQFQEPKDVVYALAFSPDGKWLAGGGADATLRVWSVDGKTGTVTLKEHSDWIQGVAFSPDSKFLASAGADRTALVWEVGTWKRLARLEKKDPVMGVAFSPDSQLVLLAVAGEEDRVLHLHKRDGGDPVRTTDLGTAAPTDLVWSPQPRPNRVVVPCTDKTLRVYDGSDGNYLVRLVGHTGWVYRAALSPDGKIVASAGADGTTKLWAIAGGMQLATLVQVMPRTDEWLIATPQGYLATSTPAALRWKATGLTTPPEGLSRLLLRPDYVQQSIAGKPVPPPDPS